VIAGSRVDVEELRAQRLVNPPAVLVTRAHVVGNDVEDDPEPGGGQVTEGLLSSEILRDAGGIDDVISVGR